MLRSLSRARSNDSDQADKKGKSLIVTHTICLPLRLFLQALRLRRFRSAFPLFVIGICSRKTNFFGTIYSGTILPAVRASAAPSLHVSRFPEAVLLDHISGQTLHLAVALDSASTTDMLDSQTDVGYYFRCPRTQSGSRAA